MNKIRTGDEVIVITGRDKGKRGKVSSRASDSHVLIDGINIVKKTRQTKPHEGHYWRHHRKGHANSPIQCGDFQRCNWQG